MTATEFAKQVSELDLNDKLKSLTKLEIALKTGNRPSGERMEDWERTYIKSLAAWLTTNILIGNELCPPTSLSEYKGGE